MKVKLFINKCKNQQLIRFFGNIIMFKINNNRRRLLEMVESIQQTENLLK